MNKQDWTYKKLGEVATIVGGSTPKSNIEEYWGGTNYWVTPADLDGNKYQGATPRIITDLAVQKTNLQLLPIGTVLLSSRAPIGKVAITTVPMYCNQGFKNVVCSDLLINEFVYWYLFGKVDYLNSLGRGATFKEISKRATEQIPIPVPPIGEQERIVAELDLLQGIIEKKKEQLKAYDQLAQSIFYTMFGDIFINNKSWDVEPLGNFCEIKGRIGFRGYTKNDFVSSPNEGAITLSPTNIVNGSMDYSKLSYVTWEKYFESPEIMIQNGDILLVKTGSSYGKCSLVRHLPHKATINPQFVVIKDIQLNNVYLTFVLSSDYAKYQYDRFVLGTAIPTFSQKSLAGLDIPVPPLSLQQEFAEKIEAIERQKALVQQSIVETQTMFDCTMDKYFG